MRPINQGEQQKKGLEETYERMFPKIGRDFVTKEDLILVISQLVAVLQANGIFIPPVQLKDTGAMAKAIIYKEIIENGKDGTKLFVDLVKIDEDEEE